MPILRAGPRLIFYAHVPKCGGSAVGWYLAERFGALAFEDRQHTRHAPQSLWSQTSPQHIDTASLGRLFPPGFFDASFTIVRHPVARLFSAYRFQIEVEALVPPETRFGDWLQAIAARRAAEPFLYDNHVRPMTEIVPEGATVFHMEHGLDALVPWFDALTGEATGPRALPKINEQGAYAKAKAAQDAPTEADVAEVAVLYAADFERFGYEPGAKMPKAPAPSLSPEVLAARDAFLKSWNSPAGKLRRKIVRRLGR